MSQREQRGPDVNDAQERLRSSGRAVPDAGFTARMRREFLAGAAARTGSPVVATRPRRVWQGLAIATLSAAAACAAVFAANQGASWQVHAISGSGSIRMGGREVAIGDSAGILSRLRAGSFIEVPEGAQLDVRLDGVALFQITSGTRVVLPNSPGRWFARTMSGRVESGELRVATGPRFKGAQLSLRADSVDVRVVGTTLAVLSQPEGTCVCVFEGQVGMSRSGNGSAQVEQGTRRVSPRDGTAARVEPIRQMESAKLSMLRREADRVLGRRKAGHIPE